jgi:hypothetical protein
MLFIRGSAMPAAPSFKGINHFPNPPIGIDITIKKKYDEGVGCDNDVIVWSSS